MSGRISSWRLGLACVATATACGGAVTKLPGDQHEETNGNAGNPHGSASGARSSAGTINATQAGAPSAAGGMAATGTAGAPDSPPEGNLDLTKTWPSSGCGQPLPAEQLPTIPGSRSGYTPFELQQTGATLGTNEPSKAGARQFFVRVPADYDPAKPYRVVYIGQGCGSLQADLNTYPLFDEAQGGSEQAVYVALSVPNDTVNPGCYDNNSGVQSQEWEMFDLVHTFVESRYCVDNNRIYVAGYSTGAWVANMWGCYFGSTIPSQPVDQPDVAAGRTERKFSPRWAIRGRLSVAGSLPANQPVPCNGPGAGLWIHDYKDGSIAIEGAIAALDLALQANHCIGNYANGPKQPWAPAENISGLQGGICQEYTGCPVNIAENYPLVFCTTNGLGHANQAASAIPAFEQFIDSMDPVP